MRRFKEPKCEMIPLNAEDIIVTSGEATCTTGTEGGGQCLNDNVGS